MKKRGWFAIPGLQAGERTLREQLGGLGLALAEARGKRVLDLGCAEGLIALEFARAGAASVYGCDNNPELVAVARELIAREHAHGVKVRLQTVDELIDAQAGGPLRYDIVLALAILHKLQKPARAVDYIARVCEDLLVVRLPLGSDGSFTTKHWRVDFDLRQELSARGFRFERETAGPRNERVWYWRK